MTVQRRPRAASPLEPPVAVRAPADAADAIDRVLLASRGAPDPASAIRRRRRAPAPVTAVH